MVIVAGRGSELPGSRILRPVRMVAMQARRDGRREETGRLIYFRINQLGDHPTTTSASILNAGNSRADSNTCYVRTCRSLI
jgi:hypothetical protein